MKLTYAQRVDAAILDWGEALHAGMIAPDDCLTIGYGINKNTGRPQVKLDGHSRTAAAYVLTKYGPPQPEGKDHALHTPHEQCGNVTCIAPHHLYWGDNADNMRDAVADGTHNEAAKTHCPKGHPLEGDNLVPWQLKNRGARQCLTCHREHNRRRRAATKRAADTAGLQSSVPSGADCTADERPADSHVPTPAADSPSQVGCGPRPADHHTDQPHAQAPSRSRTDRAPSQLALFDATPSTPETHTTDAQENRPST